MENQESRESLKKKCRESKHIAIFAGCAAIGLEVLSAKYQIDWQNNHKDGALHLSEAFNWSGLASIANSGAHTLRYLAYKKQSKK